MNYMEVYFTIRKITKLLVFVMAIVMIIPVFVSADKTTTSEKEVLLEVNVGDEVGEVGYEIYEDGSKFGPQAFAVKNNKICSDCGYKTTSSHSFVDYSTYSKCSVCGYKTTEANTAK